MSSTLCTSISIACFGIASTWMCLEPNNANDAKTSTPEVSTHLVLLICTALAEVLLTVRLACCRCSGRPFVEAKSDSAYPFQKIAARWSKQLKYTLISLPIWTGICLLLSFKFLIKYRSNTATTTTSTLHPAFSTNSGMLFSPIKFLAKKDRRGIQYGDPFPGMEHQYLEANGIRHVYA